MEASRVRVLASLSALAFSAVAFAVAGLFVDRQLQALLDDRLAEALLAQAKTVAGAVFLENTTDSVALALATGTLSATREQTGAELVVLLDARGRVLFTDPPVLGEHPYIDLDNAALASAITGKSACGERFRIGNVDLKTAFAPVFNPFGEVVAIVGIEAPADFFGALRDVRRALVVTLGLGMALVAGLVAVVWHFWARSEASERALWDSQQLAMIGQMTATMAHEVRNPLGIIKAAAERIRRKYGDGTELFDFIPDEVDRLDRLTEWYLRFARPGDLRLAKARLGSILRDSISRVRGELEAASIEVVVEDLAQSECLVDYDRLVQVNINILLNARQAIGSNGRVEAEVVEKSGVVRVEVKDNGPGIPARIQPKVFQPFFTTKTAGSGLGLPVVKQVVETLGGKVGLNSRPGEGTTVWYELPCAKNT